MKIITVATHSESYFPLFKESCLKNNLELVVLGFGQKWSGFSWKFHLISEYIEDLPLDEIVIFCDAFDVIVLNTTDILSRFQSFNSDVVISSLNMSNNLLDYISNKSFPKCHNNSINTGLYMGTVSGLKQLFQDLCFMFDCNNFKLDDQKMLSMLCPSYMAIDIESLIFYNYDILNNDIIYQSNKILTKNSIEPCIIQGPRNQNLDKIAKIYGYNPKSLLTIGPMYAFIKRIPLYITDFNTEFACLAIVIIYLIFFIKF